jgi:Ca2+-binding RTX toxin-like protein
MFFKSTRAACACAALVLAFAIPAYAATINGTSGNDNLTGTAYADNINGHAGADTLRGSGGNDTIWGGPHGDTLFGDAGADTLYSFSPSGQRNDMAVDAVHGGAGNDFINVAGGDNAYCGPGSDHVVIHSFSGGLTGGSVAADCETISIADYF